MHKQVYKCPSHTANLNSMRLKNKWCDITIKVDGKEFSAHKNILAANLQYFDTMLSDDSFRESKEGVITMECMNASDLEAFITYAYTGEITLTDDNALSLFETANYLGEDGIKKACTEFLENYLKTEDYFQVYHLTKSIGCLSLRNAAKSKILLNFENSSQSSEYLDLDFESLSDFLSDGKARSIGSQRIFFEGAMRWILHNAKARRNCVNDLLSFIDVSKLPIDYLMKYVGSIANRSDDDSGIVVKDLMSWYYTGSKSDPITKLRVAHSEQALTILGLVDGEFSFQSYNFAERKWSQPQSILISGGTLYYSCAVLNEKFYFIFKKSGYCSLNMFDPSTKLNTVLNLSSNILRKDPLCACSRFLYLCGEWKEDDCRSDQVLRYDPRTNSLESLHPMPTWRNDAAAIFYRGRLHVVGGFRGLFATNKVEKYDPDAKKWMGLPSMCEPRWQHSVAVLDEKLYVCGGQEKNSVEVYDPAKNSWQYVASMMKERDGFTLVAHEGKLLAIGGAGQPSVEVYDPSLDQWQMDAEMSSGLQFGKNMGGLVSSSSTADGQ